MTLRSTNLRRIFVLASVLVLAWGAPRAAQAGTWPQQISSPARSGAAQQTYFKAGGYRVPVETFPIRMVHLGAPPAGMTQAQVDAAAQRATAAWSQTPCSFARLEYAGQREALQQLAPDEVPFQFVDPDGPGCLPGGSIGWTALSCGPDFPTNSVFLNIRDYQWAAKAPNFERDSDTSSGPFTVELESVLTHEFGHVLGLLHSEDILATMTAAYRVDGGQRTLAVDDKLGLCALYPLVNPPDECQSGRDCKLDQSCEHMPLQSIDGAPKTQRIALCREWRGAVAPGEQPACSAAPGTPPSPLGWMSVLASALWIAGRRLTRPSRTR